MLGAIIGDIVGSRFEFNNHKSKDFDLFGEDELPQRYCCYTDDSIMTVAVADAFLHAEDLSDEHALKFQIIYHLRLYGKRYPMAGYGSGFFNWLFDNDTAPYGSYGNGSAMRVSACGWVGDTLEECERLAEIQASVTHNHPEGIKGAVAVAGSIFLARAGKSKEDIRRYIEERFYPHAFEKTLDEIRPDYEHIETCQDTVPQAFDAFYESTDFEDAIRCAVSVGGDCDTLTCIACSIAEAYYGAENISVKIREKALSFLDDRLRSVVTNFRNKYVLPKTVHRSRKNGGGCND